MNEQTITSLKEALAASPDNFPLRLLLANTFLGLNRLDEAEEQFTLCLQIKGQDSQSQMGLAEVYYKKSNYSACNVILENLINEGIETGEIYLLYAKALLQEGNLAQAINRYKKALDLNPNYYDDELDDHLRLRSQSNTEAQPENQDTRFLQKPDMDFSHVGGMEGVKKEIGLKIIKPLQHPDLYKAYGKKIGGGILLYGPPGCGKTYIAKATAGQVKANFISVGLNDILDMWLGNSEKQLHDFFELARKNAPCILFIDEIDALGANRKDMKQSAGRQLINQFLQELDGIDSSNEGVLILGATNTPWNLDPAFRRPGRFDRIIFVPPPDLEARESILKLKLSDKPIDTLDYRLIAKKTDAFSGADLDAVVDLAIEAKLEDSFIDNIPKPISTKDLVRAAKTHKSTTKEWFATAKNFATFANDSGLYDDILTHIKKK